MVFVAYAVYNGMFEMLIAEDYAYYVLLGSVGVVILTSAVVYMIKDRFNKYKPIKRKVFHLPLLFLPLGLITPFLL